MTDPSFGPVVSTEWLAAHLGDPGLRVLDATWYLPHLHRDARAEFREAHIPGAVYFDIDAIADHDQGLPHMLPSAARRPGPSRGWSAAAEAVTVSQATSERA